MAFGSKQLKITENSEKSDVPEFLPEQQEKTEKDPLAFLNPTKNAKKDSLNDPYQEEMTKKAAYQYTLKTLNALKIVSPIIGALMQKPGVDAPNEEMSESFRHLIKEISSVSGVVCQKLGIDPNKEKNYWVRNVLEKSFAEILKTQWTANGQTDTTKIVELIDDVIKFSETSSEKGQYEEINDENLVKVANIRAMLPILNEAQTNFDLYRNLENDIEPIMNKLFDISSNAVEKLADNYADSSERAKLFNIIVQEAGILYASAWHAEGTRVKEIMNAYSPDKLQKSLERYKNSGGLPLDKIEHDFDKYFEKMLVITEKLVSSNRSGIDKKLKNKV
jgi:hypothetical protein